MAAISNPRETLSTQGLIPIFDLFFEKTALQCGKIDTVCIKMLMMPFRQEGDIQRCYHKITHEKEISFPKGKNSDFSRKLANEIFTAFQDDFKVADNVGHNAHFGVILDVRVVPADSVAPQPGQIRGRHLQCELSFPGSARGNLLGVYPKNTRLIEGLDLAVNNSPLPTVRI